MVYMDDIVVIVECELKGGRSFVSEVSLDFLWMSETSGNGHRNIIVI